MTETVGGGGGWSSGRDSSACDQLGDIELRDKYVWSVRVTVLD